MRILFITCLAILTLICGSCFEKGDCVINNSNLVKVKFISTKTKKDSLVTFKSISVEGTSFSIYKDTVAVTIQLPVDPNKTEASFILKYDSARGDTLSFTYVNETIIPSSDCGAFIYQKHVTMVKNTFEGKVIKEVNNQLQRNAAVNFEIYF